MSKTRNIIKGQTQINVRGGSQAIAIDEIDGVDGVSFLRFEQPCFNRSEMNEDDMVVIDEAVQEQLYIHLSKKFAAR